MLSVLTARKKKRQVKLHLAVGFSNTDLHFYSMGFKGGKTHSVNAFQTFLYLSVFLLINYLYLHLIKHVYKLICYIKQINEANSYEKYGIGSVLKQLVNKVSLEIIILIKLYRQPEEKDRRKN